MLLRLLAPSLELAANHGRNLQLVLRKSIFSLGACCAVAGAVIPVSLYLARLLQAWAWGLKLYWTVWLLGLGFAR